MSNEDEHEWIFVRSFRTRSGKVIHASSYGKQAFRIRVRRKPRPPELK
ncbi:MAG: hypothetical protein IT355_07085 [Gemmatimonadaceae bacterium]|nr:hypothetical protein [Gemmatimonadaceae bacterium]